MKGSPWLLPHETSPAETPVRGDPKTGSASRQKGAKAIAEGFEAGGITAALLDYRRIVNHRSAGTPQAWDREAMSGPSLHCLFFDRRLSGGIRNPMIEGHVCPRCNEHCKESPR